MKAFLKLNSLKYSFNVGEYKLNILWNIIALAKISKLCYTLLSFLGKMQWHFMIHESENSPGRKWSLYSHMLSVRTFVRPHFKIDQNKKDHHCRPGLWAGRVDHWLFLVYVYVHLKKMQLLAAEFERRYLLISFSEQAGIRKWRRKFNKRLFWK